MSGRWTTEEDNQLIREYPCNRRSYLESTFSKNWTSIKRRALRLGLKRDDDLISLDRTVKKQRKDSWTTEEENLLIEIFEKSGKEELLALIDRPWAGIHSRAKKLGLTRDRDIVLKEMIEGGKKSIEVVEGIWTQYEIDLLIKNYKGTPREELLEKLPTRSWSAIRSQAFKLSLLRDPELVREENTYYTQKSVKDRYGVNSYFSTDEFKEKAKVTNQSKRGVDYPSQNKDVRDKIKKTVQERYGVDNVLQSEESKKKSKETLIRKFGEESPLRVPEIKKRVANTNNNRYGVDNTLQLTDRVKAGMVNKYGEEVPLRVSEIMEKKKQTSLDRYGYDVASKNPMVRAKLSQKLKSPEVKKKQYDTRVKNNTFVVSKEEILFGTFLNTIDPEVRHHQIHPVLGYVMDFYLPSYNLWVQYDGEYWHNKTSSGDGPQAKSIRDGATNDDHQNNNIKNLVRFEATEFKKAQKEGSVLKLIEARIKEKTSEIVDFGICHQYRKKLEHYTEDALSIPFNPSGLRTSDFDFQLEKVSSDIREFIERYEWLGSIGNTPKWCFTARYKGLIGGAVLINEPNSYSRLLGSKTPVYEALVQRGASSSWAPRNLGSKLIMFSCNWMVKNTNKRLFVGYADPAAGERGVIYRACNFDYIGNSFGNTKLYRHASMPKMFTMQSLSRTASFKAWCKKQGVPLDKSWFKDNGYKDLNSIPDHIRAEWNDWKKDLLNNSDKITIMAKMKFAKILGRDKRELRELLELKAYKPLKYVDSTEGNLCTSSIEVAHESRLTHGKTRNRASTSKTKYIIDNYSSMSRQELAFNMNETERWVKRQIKSLIKEGVLKHLRKNQKG